MHRHVKKFFIPHHENNYHPHILHTKRAVLYSSIFILIKSFLIIFVMFLPLEVFVLPDILAEEQKQIIELTNVIRVQNGVKPLEISDKLGKSAQNKADDMAVNQYFAHNYANKSVSDWVRNTGYDYQAAGENLAVGYSSAEEVVRAWQNSPEHYANLIDTDFDDFNTGLTSGIFLHGQPTVYIAQHFASPVQGRTAFGKVVNKLKEEKVVRKTDDQVVTDTNKPTSVLSAKVGTLPPLVNTHVPTPIDRYIQAKSTLSPITKIFNVSRDIYLVALILFAISLVLSIIIEIKHQHPHIILQTGGLISLLVILWMF